MFRFESIVGALLAFYFLVGRWTPSRLTADELDTDLLRQPRTWAVAMLLVLAVIPVLKWLGGEFAKRTSQQRESGVAFNVAIVALLLQIYMAATAMWAPWQASESPKFGEVLLLIAVQISLLMVMVDGDMFHFRHSFWISLIAITGVMALVAIVAQVSGRVAVLGGGPNVFGRNMGLMMLGGVYLLDHRWRGRKLGFTTCALLVVVGGLLVIMSGSRGAIVSVTAAFLALLALRRTLSLRQILPWVAIPAIACVGMMFTDVGREAVEMFQDRIVVTTFQDRYTSDRDALFLNAFQAGVENPVLGLGLDGFRTVRWDEYPHNFFLEVFAEGGGIGLLLAVLMMSFILAGYRRPAGSLDTSTIAAFALVLAAAQFSGDLYDSRGVFLFSIFSLITLPDHTDNIHEASAATHWSQSARTLGLTSHVRSATAGSESTMKAPA